MTGQRLEQTVKALADIEHCDDITRIAAMLCR